jgi:hypothetical protein
VCRFGHLVSNAGKLGSCKARRPTNPNMGDSKEFKLSKLASIQTSQLPGENLI